MTHEYKVEDMTCGHCVSRVTRTLQTFDPEATVVIDLARQRVTVDGAADRDDYAYAIREAGYTPQQVVVLPEERPR